MINIKLMNHGDELKSFPVDQSIFLEVSESITEEVLKQYVSFYRVVSDSHLINLSPPYAYNLGYLKEYYGDEPVNFIIENNKVTIDPVRPLKVSSKYILYIGNNLYSSNAKVTKTVSKSAKSTLIVETERQGDLRDSITVKILNTSVITATSNTVMLSIGDHRTTIDLKKNLTYSYGGYKYIFQDTLYLSGEEFKVELDYSSVNDKEIIYLINTAPFDSIKPIEIDKPSKAIDTEAIIAFYNKSEVLNTNTSNPVPQYVHSNSFTIPKPENFTLDVTDSVLFSIKEAFKDYTLSNIGLYDSTKKYKIYIIEEEDIFLIEVMESVEATNNIVLDSEDNIILSIEKRIL